MTLRTNANLLLYILFISNLLLMGCHQKGVPSKHYTQGMNSTQISTIVHSWSRKTIPNKIIPNGCLNIITDYQLGETDNYPDMITSIPEEETEVFPGVLLSRLSIYKPLAGIRVLLKSRGKSETIFYFNSRFLNNFNSIRIPIQKGTFLDRHSFYLENLTVQSIHYYLQNGFPLKFILGILNDFRYFRGPKGKLLLHHLSLIKRLYSSSDSNQKTFCLQHYNYRMKNYLRKVFEDIDTKSFSKEEKKVLLAYIIGLVRVPIETLETEFGDLLDNPTF